MAGNATQSVPVDLDGGRRVTIRSYADGSLRFQINRGMPYAMAEAILKGGDDKHPSCNSCRCATWMEAM
jgi:hypothetical protein